MPSTVLTRAQAREVDRRAIDDYGMHSLVLMENAGRGCVDQILQQRVRGPVAICCGKGNNAGDGFVMARHLAIHGIAPRVLLWSDPAELSGDAAVNFRILQYCDVPLIAFAPDLDLDRLDAELTGVDWVVDALLGTGASGAPRPPLDRVIGRLNASPACKLAVDVPSGLDCDTGRAAGAVFRADHTCTFVAPKPGLLSDAARPYVGQLHVVDIGVPPRLVREIVSSESSGGRP